MKCAGDYFIKHIHICNIISCYILYSRNRCYLFIAFSHYIVIIELHCQSLFTTSSIFDNAYKKLMVASIYIKNNVTLVIKNDHRLLPRYLKYHAPFQGTASSRARCLSTSTTLLPGSSLSKKKKFVCVYLLQVGQALAMRCRCRAPDFDITGRNIKSDICLLKKFSVCAVYMRKKICGSLAL